MHTQLKKNKYNKNSYILINNNKKSFAIHNDNAAPR